MCRVYFAYDFERLRELVLPQDNPRISLARSLSRTTNWQARGGKSGSKFSKTLGKFSFGLLQYICLVYNFFIIYLYKSY